MKRARVPARMTLEQCTHQATLAQRRAIRALRQPSDRRASTVPDWPDWIIGHPFIPPEQLDDDFRDAFRKVPMVAAAISRVQHDVASLPLRVWVGEGERRREMPRRDGNLVDLLKKANPRDTGYQLRVNTTGSLKTHGNAYWYKQRFPGSGREPRELWELRAHLMEVVPGPNRGMIQYWYNRGGVKSEIPPDDIVHFRKYNPDDHPIGMSELEPVRKQYQAQFYADIWIKEFYRKGGMLSGVWTLKDSTRKLQDKDIEAIIARLKALHVGYAKAWDPVVIEALEFVRRGMTISEMEIDKQMDMINSSICRALGVPPWMMGIKEGSTLGSSGAGVDLNDYVFGTLKREATLIDTTINEQLAPLFGTGIEVETDFSSHPAIQGAMLERSKSLVIATGRSIMTVNEARKQVDLPEHDDVTADELYTRPEPTLGFGGAGGTTDTPAGDEPKRSAAKLKRSGSMIDGDEHREQLRRRASSAIQRAESKMLAFITGRLDRQQRVAERRLEERWAKEHPKMSKNGRARLVIDIDRLLDPETDGEEARVRQILKDLLRQRGREAVLELSELVDVAEKIDISLQSERVARFLDEQVDRAIIVPDGTTAQALRDSLAEGVNANESLADLTARVRSVFETRQSMAATIARTETLPGFNLATQEAWLESGLVEENEWLSARDAEVRPAHSMADGDKRPLGEPFIVDGEPLEYPGDPSGSAGNVINCRCTLIPVVAEGALSSTRWTRYWHNQGWNQPPKNGNGHMPNRIRKWFEVGVTRG